MRLSSHSSLALALFVSAFSVFGCAADAIDESGGDDSVNPHGVVIDRSTHALTSGDLQFVNGTFTNCTSRSGSWSLSLGGGATMDHPALSVVKNDTACELTLTSLVAGDSQSPVEYFATPEIAMDGSFKSSASRFAITTGSGDPVIFYANAKLSAVSFAADFDMTIKYSDDPSAASGSNTAGFAVSTASAIAESVPAPDYTVTMTTMSLETDAAKIVQDSVTGYAQLNAGSAAGQTWIVTDTLATSSYADVDGAYLAGTPAAMPALNRIPAAAFDLVGVDLSTPATRFLVIANTSDGVRSYEVVTITFNGPA
jgi:hypothetical protein